MRLTDLRIFPVNRGGAVPSAANWAELEQRLRQSMYHSVAEQALHPDVVDTHHETPLEDKERRRPMCVNACQVRALCSWLIVSAHLCLSCLAFCLTVHLRCAVQERQDALGHILEAHLEHLHEGLRR